MWVAFGRVEALEFQGARVGFVCRKQEGLGLALFALDGGGWLVASGLCEGAPETLDPVAVAIVPDRWSFDEVTFGTSRERTQLAKAIGRTPDTTAARPVAFERLEVRVDGFPVYRSHLRRENVFRPEIWEQTRGQLVELYEIGQGRFFVGAVGMASKFTEVGVEYGRQVVRPVILWRVRVFGNVSEFVRWEQIPKPLRQRIRESLSDRM